MPQVKLLTYNIHHGENIDGKYDLEAICGVLKASGAQIITLQEVDKNWSARSLLQDQVKILSNCLTYENTAFAASIQKDSNALFGNALISKYKISESQVYHFYINDNPSLKYDGTTETEPRSLLVTQVEIGKSSIWVLVTHLSVHSQEQRLRQVNKIINVIEDLSGPLILMGDLNSNPASEELERLGEVLADLSNNKVLITKPVEAKQIDYVLARGLKVENVRVIKSDASDHYPVLAEITLG